MFSADGVVDYYLPAGDWTHLLTGELRVGPGWHRETYDFSSLPLFVRPGAVLPRGARVDRPDTDHLDGLTLEVYRPVDGAEPTVSACRCAGTATFVVRRTGAELSVTATGTDQPWRVRVIGTDGAAEPTAAEPTATEPAVVGPSAAAVGAGVITVRLG